jgi:hypothetical protein
MEPVVFPPSQIRAGRSISEVTVCLSFEIDAVGEESQVSTISASIDPIHCWIAEALDTEVNAPETEPSCLVSFGSYSHLNASAKLRCLSQLTPG